MSAGISVVKANGALLGSLRRSELLSGIALWLFITLFLLVEVSTVWAKAAHNIWWTPEAWRNSLCLAWPPERAPGWTHWSTVSSRLEEVSLGRLCAPILAGYVMFLLPIVLLWGLRRVLRSWRIVMENLILLGREGMGERSRARSGERERVQVRRTRERMKRRQWVWASIAMSVGAVAGIGVSHMAGIPLGLSVVGVSMLCACFALSEGRWSANGRSPSYQITILALGAAVALGVFDMAVETPFVLLAMLGVWAYVRRLGRRVEATARRSEEG